MFRTLDGYVAGFLALRGFGAQLLGEGNKIVFAFDSTPELQAAIADYHSGAMVKASLFAAAVKAVKGRVHDTRREKENRLEPNAARLV